MSFLAKQTDLQLTQSRIAETGRKGREVHHKGILEADLIEGKKKDVRGLGKGYDWYWLTVTDRLTGYLDVEHFLRKTAKGANAQVPVAMERILDRMEAALGTPIKVLYTDDGSEFKARTKTLPTTATSGTSSWRGAAASRRRTPPSSVSSTGSTG